MARVAQQGLSTHKTKGFRISLGKKPQGGYRTFWLGKDRVIAEYTADVLRGQFEHMKGAGRDVWTEADDATVAWYTGPFRAQMIAVRQRNVRDVRTVERDTQLLNDFFSASPPVATAPPAPTMATPKLHAAIDEYVVAFQSRAVSGSHKERTRQLLDDLKHFRTDVPLATVDRIWLQTLTDHVKSRPVSRARKTRLSPYTVRNMLRAWSRFVDWLDANADSDRFGRWEAPRRWEELFEVKLSKLMSKAERDARADGPKHLTAEQIVRLYQATKNDCHRICVLLGTFAALGQREIASLRREEFDLTSGILTHRRSKTGQIGKFWLPPEATKLIRRYFRDVRSDGDGTAFFTAEHELLVTDKSDAVRQAWTDIVDRVNKEAGKKILKIEQGFYALRKFTADYAMRKSGPALRDAFLAHAPTSIGAKHYSNSRDFDEVFSAGKALADELRSLGMFIEKADPMAITGSGSVVSAA